MLTASRSTAYGSYSDAWAALAAAPEDGEPSGGRSRERRAPTMAAKPGRPRGATPRAYQACEVIYGAMAARSMSVAQAPAT
jgi:hypothetical protein